MAETGQTPKFAPTAAEQSSAMMQSPKPERGFLLKLELSSDPKMLRVVRGALEPLMETIGFTTNQSKAIVRAVDEAVSNIMRHAYHGRPNEPIEIYCNRLQPDANAPNGESVEVLLFDAGSAIDTTKIEPRSLDEIRPGGLGLHIIRAGMDVVEYKRVGDQNCLRLIKYSQPAKSGAEPQQEKAE